MDLPVDGATVDFPDCPAAYLRTVDQVQLLTDRWGKKPFSGHLIDGVTHPGSIISNYAAEIESGARSVDSVSPRAMALVHLWNRELRSKREYEAKKRKDT